jgi:hypothetical protein
MSELSDIVYYWNIEVLEFLKTKEISRDEPETFYTKRNHYNNIIERLKRQINISLFNLNKN